MKVLLLSSSARGHAIAEVITKSRHKPELISICTTRNPGIRNIASAFHVGDLLNIPWVLDIASKAKPDFAVIGPDDPIGAGLADELEKIGIPTVAPKKALARIETSKGFARELMATHGIDASPKFRVFVRTPFSNVEPSVEMKNMYTYIDQDLQGSYVVKYDALKGGKGVKVSGEHLQSIDEGVQYAMECLEECGRVVIEEKLVGVEFSVLSFVSGTQLAHMPAVQDHKRAFDGDTGPNTGGMGTYTDRDSSLPFLTPIDLARAKDLNMMVAKALKEECGQSYKGILYGGFIAVKDGIRVIEYNARFGDPEALNILPLLETDFVDVCQAIVNESLDQLDVRFSPKATVCKYITPKSYPEAKKEKGQPVKFPEMPDNARIYFGDIAEDDDGTLKLGGSRTAGIVGIGDSIKEAEQIAEKLCEQVEGPVRFRKDIGTEMLIQKRIDDMKHLRR